MATTLDPRDERAIADLHREWIRRELAGPPDAIVDLCTPGIVLLAPGEPPISGRAAVREWLRQPGPELLGIDADITWIRGRGGSALKLASFRTTFRDTVTGAPHTVAGHHLWALERDVSGHWRVSLLTWTLRPDA